MNFTEFEFWPRLLIGLAIIGVCRFLVPKNEVAYSRYDRGTLALLSLVLLSSVGWITTVVFTGVFLCTWLLLNLMFRLPQAAHKSILWIGIPLLFTPLIYYKYRIFIATEILDMDPSIFQSVAIPAGISFYTFQKVAVLVDASRMTSWKPRFLDYLNFASFFPQVVAGPIERKDDLFPQMQEFRFRWSWMNLDGGIPFLAAGLFYKLCLADNLTTFIDRDRMDSAWPILLCTFLFGLKIYFDFCGYSLIALGIAKCLGVNLTLNFRSPYWSGNIREFWRRWHISLSYWFRDYIYIPLGGSQTKRWALNLLIVFTLSGIWHGAGWGFLIWGALHGVFSVISHFFKDRFKLPWLAGWPVTMACVFLSWLPFYETRFAVLSLKLAILLTPSSWSPSFLSAFLKSFEGGHLISMACVISLCLVAISLEGITRLRKQPEYSFTEHPFAVFSCMACVILLGSSTGNEFIYFAF